MGKRIIEFLTEQRSGGGLSLLGGHYAWPGRPDRFAIDSVMHIAQMAEEFSSGPVYQAVFLDDIGASMACSGGTCDVNGAPTRLRPLPVESIGPWVASSLATVERQAVARETAWMELAGQLREIVRRKCEEDGDAVHPLLEYLAKTDPNDERGTRWLEALEMLVYMADKPSFRPLLLGIEARIIPPPVLFERTITNAASRTLHKMKKTAHGARLHTTVDDGGVTTFWVRGQGDARIELRREEDGGARSANKCAGILSQLFFHVVKNLGKQGAGTGTVLYTIPCYDRPRLRDGMQAFFELYRDTEHWFGIKRVTLSAAFYSKPDRSEMLCDTFSFDSAREIVRVSTEKLLMPPTARGATSSGPSARPSVRRIYVDNNATTSIDPGVLDAMLPFMGDCFGNPSSAHSFGWEAEHAVAQARESVAALIGADPDEIIFTSGATESNNWILRHWAEVERKSIISTRIEHKSVVAVLDVLRDGGSRVAFVPISPEGKADLAEVEAALTPGALVSLMACNNEVHTLLDLDRVGALCARRDAFFHTDAAQAIGRVPIDVRRSHIHAMSLSAHKIHGPKGIGALYIERSLQKRIAPAVRGGGQERGMRSGTLATNLIVGFGAACAIAAARLEEESRCMRHLSELFLHRLAEQGIEFTLVGPASLSDRRPGSLCLSIPQLDATRLCEILPDVALSQASACNGQGVGSHVLRELGFSVAAARSVIRLAFARNNSEDDALYVADRLVAAARAPHWLAAWVA